MANEDHVALFALGTHRAGEGLSKSGPSTETTSVLETPLLSYLASVDRVSMGVEQPLQVPLTLGVEGVPRSEAVE